MRVQEGGQSHLTAAQSLLHGDTAHTELPRRSGRERLSRWRLPLSVLPDTPGGSASGTPGRAVGCGPPFTTITHQLPQTLEGCLGSQSLSSPSSCC